MCYDRGEGNGKCSGTGAKPHSTVSSFQNGAARTVQGTAPMDPPLFGADFIRRRQKRRKKVRLSKTPSQPARDKGCGTQSPDTHNAACGIETPPAARWRDGGPGPDTHNAACGIETLSFANDFVKHGGPDTHNAACGIETYADFFQHARYVVPTHTMLRAALKHDEFPLTTAQAGVPTHTMLRAALTAKRLCVSTSVTQSRFRMQKSHSNLDDAAHRW